MPKVKWDIVCEPKVNGGLGVIAIDAQADALMIRTLTPLLNRAHFNRSFVHTIIDFFFLVWEFYFHSARTMAVIIMGIRIRKSAKRLHEENYMNRN